MPTTKAEELVKECKRQVDNCLYTSASLYIWLRHRRNVKTAFIVIPLALGSFATWELITRQSALWVRIVAGFAAFIAGLMPAIYSALKYDDDLEACKLSAAEFRNIGDRFRQVATVSSRLPFAEFKADFEAVMARMEKAREVGLTAPEKYFNQAQEKINKGDYSFDVDLPPEQPPANPQA